MARRATPRHRAGIDDPSGISADVRLADDLVRPLVLSSSQQSDLLDRIDDCLSTIDSRATERRRRQVRRGGRRGAGVRG